MPKNSFHLRWNNHLQNLQSLFENLYNEQMLVDVTISCSDGMLYGHKLVLCACSPYFEQVLKDNPCKHPILILRGVSYRVMRLLLEYMYKGAVDVVEEELGNMLDTATDLQIKGLVKTDAERFKQSKQEKYEASPTPIPIPQPVWEAELQPSFKDKEEQSISKNIKTELNMEEDINTVDDNSDDHQNQENDHETEQSSYSNYDIHEILEEADRENSEEEAQRSLAPGEAFDESLPNSSFENKQDQSNPWFCHLCSKCLQSKTSYQRHMLTHAGVKPHQCTFCSQSFLRLSHLQRHIRVHTGERPYACGQCPKQFARSDKLRQHYIINHNAPNNVRVPRGRGRPRKHFLPSASVLNSTYSVSINSIPMNAV